MKKLDENQDEPCKKYDVRLTFRLGRIAKKLGGGNLSAGIRAALERAAAQDDNAGETYLGDVAVKVPCRSCE